VTAIAYTGISGPARNRRIAKTLLITEKTASVHVTHILAKLQVTNRSEAGAIARGHGKASR
jgi:DNA-binding NarL/FixJ family response regulator